MTLDTVQNNRLADWAKLNNLPTADLTWQANKRLAVNAGETAIEYVAPWSNTNLGDLENVTITTPSEWQVIRYDSAGDEWINDIVPWLWDVNWPISSTDNAITRFNWTTWKTIQDSNATIDDSWNITANNLSWTNTWDQDLTPLVTWPASAVDDNIATYNSTTWKLIQDWWATIAQVRDRTTHTGTQAETTISFTDITTNNVSTSKHWYTPKLSWNSTQFLDWNGNYSTPAWIVNSYTTQTFTAQTSVVVNHSFWAYPLIQILGTSNEELVPNTITHNSINQFTVTFVISTTWTIIASVWSPQAANLTTATWNYTIQNGDNIIKCTWLGSTITLPTAVSIAWIEFKIDNASAWEIFVDTTWSETIQDEAIQPLPSQSSLTVYSDGTNWRIN